MTTGGADGGSDESKCRRRASAVQSRGRFAIYTRDICMYVYVCHTVGELVKLVSYLT